MAKWFHVVTAVYKWNGNRLQQFIDIRKCIVFLTLEHFGTKNVASNSSAMCVNIQITNRNSAELGKGMSGKVKSRLGGKRSDCSCVVS